MLDSVINKNLFLSSHFVNRIIHIQRILKMFVFHALQSEV